MRAAEFLVVHILLLKITSTVYINTTVEEYLWLDVCRHLYNNTVVLTQGTNSMNEPQSCLAVQKKK